jgi:hypothetical protein
MALNPASPFPYMLFAQNGAGTACTGTTSAGNLLLASKASTTYGLPNFGADYFQADYGISKSVKIWARGVISLVSAASVQTLTMGVYSNTADSTASAASWSGTTTLGVTPTITPQASQAVTNAIWTLDVDLVALTTGSAGTFQAIGTLTIAPNAAVTLGTVNGTVPAQPIGVGGTATVSMNTEAANYIGIGATWGASNSSVSNTLTCYEKFVYSFN